MLLLDVNHMQDNLFLLINLCELFNLNPMENEKTNIKSVTFLIAAAIHLPEQSQEYMDLDLCPLPAKCAAGNCACEGLDGVWIRYKLNLWRTGALHLPLVLALRS